MFLSGLVALAQASFLPGFLVVYGLRLCRGPLRVATCTFCLSALVNLFVVRGSLLLGVYTTTTLWLVVGAELGLLSFLLFRRGVTRPLVGAEGDGHGARTGATVEPSAPGGGDRSFELGPVFAFMALAAVGLAFSEAFLRLGDTFALDDALESWNRWAMEMAAGEWPRETLLYPQLVPANYSLFYVFTGHATIWFFAKAWVSLFFPVLLLSMYELSLEEDRREAAPGVVLTLWLFYAVMTRPFVYGGIVDIALATFALVAVSAVSRAGGQPEDAGCRRELALGALFTVAAALTKQGGVYLLLAFPLLVWMLVGRGAGPGRRRLVRAFLARAVGIMILAVLPWYATMLPEAGARGDSLLETLTFRLHGGRGLGERLAHAVGLLEARISWWGLVALALLAGASLADRRHRKVLLIVTVPYVLLWATAFSYDHRNVALALPLLGLAAGIGLGRVGHWVESLGASVPGLTRPRLRRAGAAAIGLAVLVALAAHYSEHRLHRLHNRRLIDSVSVPRLNHRLDEFFRENPQPGQVLTTYKSMRWVPSLRARFYPEQIHRYTPLASYRELLEEKEVHFVLDDSRKRLPEVARYLEGAERAGELERVFRILERFTLYRKNRGQGPARGDGLEEGGRR